MLFWFRDSCHWYQEATLFRVRAPGAVTRGTIAPVLTPQRRMHCTRPVAAVEPPCMKLWFCTVFQNGNIKKKRADERCGPSFQVSILLPPIKSKLGASGEKKHISHMCPQTSHRHKQVSIDTQSGACKLTHTHIHTRTVDMDWCPPYLVVIYDRSSIEATVIWEMMTILIW